MAPSITCSRKPMASRCVSASAPGVQREEKSLRPEHRQQHAGEQREERRRHEETERRREGRRLIEGQHSLHGRDVSCQRARSGSRPCRPASARPNGGSRCWRAPCRAETVRDTTATAAFPLRQTIERIHRQHEGLRRLQAARINHPLALGMGHFFRRRQAVSIWAAARRIRPPGAGRTSDRGCSPPSCCAAAS